VSPISVVLGLLVLVYSACVCMLSLFLFFRCKHRKVAEGAERYTGTRATVMFFSS